VQDLKLKRALIGLLLGMILGGNAGAAADTVILWDKPIDGYIGNIKVANNGNVVFFYKSDAFSPAADVVACNIHGDYIWNKRFINKVRDIVIAPSGDKIAAVSMQPKQTGKKPVVFCIKEGKEIWQLPGGERVTFAPLENYILSFNDGQTGSGVFLYGLGGNPVWHSEKIALTDGQSDNMGQMICGIHNDSILFINVSKSQFETYQVEKPVACYAFDPQNKYAFIADSEQLFCYGSKMGMKWSLKTDKPIYKIIPDPMRQRVTVYTRGKAYVVSYDRKEGFYNTTISEEQLIQNLGIDKERYCFADNRKYLVVYRNQRLTLYRVGAD
jgi:hypothetical protein